MKKVAYNQISGRQKGFAMLFAVLVSSVLLSIGLSIFNLTVKELVLSSSGRESQFSFYAADTGAECAMYWDFKASYPVMYATSSASQTGSWRDSYIDSNNPNCVGTSIVDSVKTPIITGLSSATTQFSLTIPNGSNSYCSVVKVLKEVDNSGFIKTTIDSRGYNTCNASDPNRVERGLKVTY